MKKILKILTTLFIFILLFAVLTWWFLVDTLQVEFREASDLLDRSMANPENLDLKTIERQFDQYLVQVLDLMYDRIDIPGISLLTYEKKETMLDEWVYRLLNLKRILMKRHDVPDYELKGIVEGLRINFENRLKQLHQDRNDADIPRLLSRLQRVAVTAAELQRRRPSSKPPIISDQKPVVKPSQAKPDLDQKIKEIIGPDEKEIAGEEESADIKTRGEKPEENQEEPTPQAPVKIPMNKVQDYIGRQVNITLNDGRVQTGEIKAVDALYLYLRVKIEGGSMSAKISKQRIRNIETVVEKKSLPPF